ncbi:elongation factor 1-beta [archaeon]|nr:elongation factor 1-beta [archaeon]
MGEVIAVFKIMPKDSDSFEVMKEQVLAAVGKIEKIEEEYVAFGLKSLKITVLMEDSEGGTDALEQKITSIDKVGSMELEGIGRI